MRVDRSKEAFIKENENKIICSDALETLKNFPDESISCCITSPPYYGLRDYHKKGQIGREKTVEEYLDRLVAVFREVRRWHLLCCDWRFLCRFGRWKGTVYGS